MQCFLNKDWGFLASDSRNRFLISSDHPKMEEAIALVKEPEQLDQLAALFLLFVLTSNNESEAFSQALDALKETYSNTEVIDTNEHN